jgi:hypothetical protein
VHTGKGALTSGGEESGENNLRRKTWTYTCKEACTRGGTGEDLGMIWEGKLGCIRAKGRVRIEGAHMDSGK